MSTVKEDLLKAAALIEEEGWCRGKYLNADGQRCVLGALSDVTADLPVDADRRLRRAINHLKRGLNITVALVEWNDDPRRTKDEVFAALHAAAEVAS